MKERPLAILTADEEVTLRRVAYGQSEARSLRAADLERLQRLRLIEPGKGGPRLTISGKTHFDSLSRSVFAPAPPRPEGPPLREAPRQFVEPRSPGPQSLPRDRRR